MDIMDRLNEGMRYFNNGDYTSTIREFSHIIEELGSENPYICMAYTIRGQSYLNLGDNEANSDAKMALYNKAYSDCKIALQKTPYHDNDKKDKIKQKLAEIEQAIKLEAVKKKLIEEREYKEREERERKEREEREHREREERERKEREHQEWLKTEEGQKWLKDETLSRFNSAKAKISIGFAAVGYDNLARDFASIVEDLRSFPDSFGVQAQIEECEALHKQCEEKKNQCKKDEFLSLLNTAKAAIPACRTADEYDNLARKFAGIGVDLKSLPSLFDVQVQIEECEACRKQCREKENQLKAEEEQRCLEEEACVEAMRREMVSIPELKTGGLTFGLVMCILGLLPSSLGPISLVITIIEKIDLYAVDIFENISLNYFFTNPDGILTFVFTIIFLVCITGTIIFGKLRSRKRKKYKVKVEAVYAKTKDLIREASARENEKVKALLAELRRRELAFLSVKTGGLTFGKVICIILGVLACIPVIGAIAGGRQSLLFLLIPSLFVTGAILFDKLRSKKKEKIAEIESKYQGEEKSLAKQGNLKKQDVAINFGKNFAMIIQIGAIIAFFFKYSYFSRLGAGYGLFFAGYFSQS